MSDDPLDKEVSLGAELTPSGLNAKAKSRFVAAFDRLCGNAVEFLNVPMERRISKARAEIEGQKQLIEAVTKAAVDRMGKDAEFAERAIRNHLGIAIERQENKDGVVRHAIEDLNRNKATTDSNTGLDPGFINKFERYAEDAGTEQLREKWGRVLSSEIRKPGTATPMVLRIVDELDSETAHYFEELCKFRLGMSIPRCLMGPLDFRESTKLESAGLMMAPGFGQVHKGTQVVHQGEEMWWFGFGPRSFTIPRGYKASLSQMGKDEPLATDKDGRPKIPVYVLTDAGAAVAEILPDHSEDAFNQYLTKLAPFVKDVPVRIWRPTGVEGQWAPVGFVEVEPNNSA
jgi:hypothetical protein